LGNDKLAQTVFERILAIDPQNYSFHLDLADIHFKRREYREAEERINAFLARRPNDRQAKMLLGKLHAEMGNRTHAIQIFEELAKADPSDTEALAAAAELYKSASALEKAVQTADKLVNEQGKRASANDLSDLNKSLDFYEHAVSAYSNSVKEMWERNMKLAAGVLENEEISGESEECDNDDRLGAAETVAIPEEEMESLLVEDLISPKEILQEDDPIDEFIPEEEEESIPIFDERMLSLDDLAGRLPLRYAPSGYDQTGGGSNAAGSKNSGGGMPIDDPLKNIGSGNQDTGKNPVSGSNVPDENRGADESRPAIAKQENPPQPQNNTPPVFIYMNGAGQPPQQENLPEPHLDPEAAPEIEELYTEEGPAPAIDTEKTFTPESVSEEVMPPFETAGTGITLPSPDVITKAAALGLLHYLQTFIDSLPPPANSSFTQTDIHDQVKHIISVLEGNDNV
jgi:tetratricopeptide (TPR) repeat protein